MFYQMQLRPEGDPGPNPGSAVILTRDVYEPSDLMSDWAKEHEVTIVAEDPMEIIPVGRNGQAMTYHRTFYAEGHEDNVILMRLRFSF